MAPTAGVTYSEASYFSATWYDAFVIMVEYLRRDLVLKRNLSHSYVNAGTFRVTQSNFIFTTKEED